MKWFKHDSAASMDAKLQKVMIKYGLSGYGLYWYCLECIAGNISETNLTFELEHDAEIIAHHGGMDSRMVEEIMSYMVTLGLFENSEGTITCLKMAKRIDQSMTSSPTMRKLIAGSKSHDKVMTNPDNVMQEEKRTEQKRIRDSATSRTSETRFLEFWALYPKKTGKKKCAEIWKRRKLDSLADIIIADTTRRRIDDAQWNAGYIPNPQTYLNGDRWEDEIQTQQPKPKRNGSGTAEDVGRAYEAEFGKPPPPGKTTDEVRAMISQRRDKETTWWNG